MFDEDELERTQSHLLVDQMARYFRSPRTWRSQGRSRHPGAVLRAQSSDDGQLADLVAYTIAWNVRVGKMSRPTRPEMDPLGQIVARLRYRAVREVNENPDFAIWSIAVIDDLRARVEHGRLGAGSDGSDCLQCGFATRNSGPTATMLAPRSGVAAHVGRRTTTMWKSLITTTCASPAAGPWVEVSTRPSTRAQNASRSRSLRGMPLVHQGSHEGAAACCPSVAGLCAMIVGDPCAHTNTSPPSSNADSAAVTRHRRGWSSTSASESGPPGCGLTPACR